MTKRKIGSAGSSDLTLAPPLSTAPRRPEGRPQHHPLIRSGERITTLAVSMAALLKSARKSAFRSWAHRASLFSSSFMRCSVVDVRAISRGNTARIRRPAARGAGLFRFQQRRQACRRLSFQIVCMTCRLRWRGTCGARRCPARPAGTIAGSCRDTWSRPRGSAPGNLSAGHGGC